MFRGKFQVTGFILLSVSIMMLIVMCQHQATTPNPVNGAAIQRQLWSLWPFGKQPPQASDYLSEEVAPERVNDGPHLLIKLRDRRVYLYQNKKLKISYPIAVGKAGWETPTGNYQVLDMQRHPVWEEPWTGKVILDGPKNPLGERWIGFWTDNVNSIGFHGTPAENLIGQAVSHGCVRMRNQDIIALFEQVKLGTPVTVKP